MGLRPSFPALSIFVAMATLGCEHRYTETLSLKLNPAPIKAKSKPAPKWTFESLAGDYVTSTSEVKLNSDGTAGYRMLGDIMPQPDFVAGTYKIVGDERIEISPKDKSLESHQFSILKLYGSLYPVKWGKATFLLPPSQMINFISEYRQGWVGDTLPLASMFLIRYDDYDKALAKSEKAKSKEVAYTSGTANAAPILPDKFRSLLTNIPIATVTRVHRDGTLDLDKGIDDFYMQTTFLVHRGTGPTAMITKADAHSSTVRVEGGVKPEVGWKFEPFP